MKKIVILSFLFLFAKLSFAESGWQLGATVPIGASFSFYNVYFSKDAPQSYKDAYRKNSGTVGFDAGITFQAGYLVTDEEKGISLLVDIGYSHDSFGLKSSYKDGVTQQDVDVREYYTFENMQIGILPKFHYNNFAFGLGIGIKVPLYLTHSAEFFNDNTSTKTFSYYDVGKIDDVMKNIVMTYIKLTFDYSFNIQDNVALLVGAYIGTDFGIDLRGAEKVLVESRNLASLDIGAQVGMKFGTTIGN